MSKSATRLSFPYRLNFGLQLIRSFIIYELVYLPLYNIFHAGDTTSVVVAFVCTIVGALTMDWKLRELGLQRQQQLQATDAERELAVAEAGLPDDLRRALQLHREVDAMDSSVPGVAELKEKAAAAVAELSQDKRTEFERRESAQRRAADIGTELDALVTLRREGDDAYMRTG